MIHIIIDTPYARVVGRAFLPINEFINLIPRYLKAKKKYDWYRRDGYKHRHAVAYTAKALGISYEEAQHRIKLKLENLDSVDVPENFGL